jgi:hypothetical protein
MSLVFRHRNSSPYLHIAAPRSPLKIVVAFIAGAICAGILLHRTGETAKFLRPADDLTSGFSTDGQAARAMTPVQRSALGLGGEADANGNAVADEKERSAAADAANAPQKRKYHVPRGQRQEFRNRELPDGRRITVYRDAAVGSDSPGADAWPQRGWLAPFRLNAPSLTR